MIRVVLFSALLALSACGDRPTKADGLETPPASTSARSEESLFETHLVTGACFARAYDAAHLRAHPRQTVTTFFIADPGPAWRGLDSPGQRHVALGFRVKGDPDLYTATGVCAPHESRADCVAENDAGVFTMQADGANLRIGIARLELEGATRFSPDLARADNRTIILSPADSAACPSPE